MKRRLLLVAVGLCLASMLVVVLDLTGLARPVRPAQALSGTTYTISWYTIDGGGGMVTGGNYSLTGTIGQPDAGSVSGGVYTVAGGFWSSWAQEALKLFLPLIQR